MNGAHEEERQERSSKVLSFRGFDPSRKGVITQERLAHERLATAAAFEAMTELRKVRAALRRDIERGYDVEVGPLKVRLEKRFRAKYEVGENEFTVLVVSF